MVCYIWIIILFALNWTNTLARQSHFLRKDYTYIEQYNTYFKMHFAEHQDWHQVLSTCSSEKATIFVPKTRGEFHVISTLTRQRSHIWSKLNFRDAKCLFAGNEDGATSTTNWYDSGYEDVADELNRLIPKPTCLVLELKTAVYKYKVCDELPMPLLFICKKQKDVTCPTLHKGYTYVEKLRKCYKIHNYLKTWKEASDACYDEGAMLAVLEPMEAETMRDILNDQDFFAFSQGLTSKFYYFHIVGKKIDAKSESVPANCVQFSRNARQEHNTSSTCLTRLPFICEMEVFY